nr:MAG: barnase-EndoU-ColicinE5/D-RelE like nuclease4 [Bacteriophage sp.]
MLTIEQMINDKSQMTDINNVSLKLYKQFYIDVLCKRHFQYTTLDGEKINLLFNETEFMHLLGAGGKGHILGSSYSATKFNEEIDNGNMTFDILQQRNSIQFTDSLDRFLGFANIYYILTNCEAIYFNKDIYNNNTNPKRNAKCNYKYILFQDLFSKKLHVGIDTYNRGYSYYAKSLLVVSEQNKKFIEKQTPLYITNIKVIDRGTKAIIQDINIDEVAITG